MQKYWTILQIGFYNYYLWVCFIAWVKVLPDNGLKCVKPGQEKLKYMNVLKIYIKKCVKLGFAEEIFLLHCLTRCHQLHLQLLPPINKTLSLVLICMIIYDHMSVL